VERYARIRDANGLDGGRGTRTLGVPKQTINGLEVSTKTIPRRGEAQLNANTLEKAKEKREKDKEPREEGGKKTREKRKRRKVKEKK